MISFMFEMEEVALTTVKKAHPDWKC